ncbi:riboflavin-binding protein-like isoform X2 [Montipora foliosa]|uniref:riboflavin-binding protein-like isoform X2 n=1 Tax=Montipora foliosa TaxID=591990 RepID=UPI0035F1F7D2
MARGAVILVFSFLLACIGGVFCNEHEVTECIEGPLHKDKPSPEGQGYVECLSWKENSCCTAEFTQELQRNKVEVLYNFSWNHCNNLSQACEQFIKDEECFWQCEPNLIKWHTGQGALNRVPICSSYCDEWFEACKDDMTCAQDWINGFNFSSNVYSCPTNSRCRTFSEVYKDGKGLCNTMWANSFHYETSKNCMVMKFSGDANPNDRVTSASNLSKFGYRISLLVIASFFLGMC